MREELVSGEWSRLREAASAVRHAVFVREQGIDEALEWDAQDALSLHLVAFRDGVPVGTGRLLPDGHIGRMAVLPAYRRGGLGGRILEQLVAHARKRGHAEVLLSAQTAVLGFYLAHGFTAFGEVYQDVGIAHQAMRRRLASGAGPQA